MLQAARRAHRSALLGRTLGAAALDGWRSALARRASTAAKLKDASPGKDPKAQAIYDIIDPVVLFYEHPRKLLDAVKAVVETGSVRQTGHLLSQLVANPVVENRWDAVREVLALPGVPAESVGATSSHADAFAQLSKLPADSRARTFGLIVRRRYEDESFPSAKDLISAFPLGEPAQFAGPYFSAMPLHIHRLQLNWERNALARYGTAADARRYAAEQLVLVEEHLLKHHPAVLEDTHIRELLLRAFGAAHEREHAQRHWNWLRERQGPLASALDFRLAAAADVAELAAVWTEARAGRPDLAYESGAPILHVETVLVLHYARLGGEGTVHDFLSFRPNSKDKFSRWVARARESEAHGGQVPDNVAVPEPFKLLRASGMDWDGVAFMLGPFSPYSRILAIDRMRHSFGTRRRAESASSV